MPTPPSGRVARTALALAGTLAMGVLSALPGAWEVYGAPPLEVTPRGTGPLLPGLTPIPVVTPTPVPPSGQGPGVTPVSSPTPRPAPGAGGPSPSAPSPTPSISPAPVLDARTPVVAAPPFQPADAQGRPAPLMSEMVLAPGAGGVFRSSDGLVIFTLPSGFPKSPTRLVYGVTALAPPQRAAAERQRLFQTNLAFSLALDPPVEQLPPYELSARFLAVQAAGIQEQSLALYHFEPQPDQWVRLEHCQVVADQGLVRCQGNRTGTFLLAGAEGQARPPEGQGQGGAVPVPWEPLVGLVAFFALVAALWRAAVLRLARRAH
ncbi:MAG: hypothetical protein HYY02_02760 [Chloroflexi bacterium]|nr:hypothetical protein [Chloroflexota bacterium]